MIERSGSVPLKNGAGPGLRIRIRIPGAPKPHGSYGSGSWNDPDPEVGFLPKKYLPEVPGEEGEEKLPNDKEIFDDDATEDALAPTHKLNGQHEGGLENARLKMNKNAREIWRKKMLERNSGSMV
jgi:hypothetical protein